MSDMPYGRDMGQKTGIIEQVDVYGCAAILRDDEGNSRPFLAKEIRGYDGRDVKNLYKLGFIKGALVRFDPTGKGAENVVVVDPVPDAETILKHAPREAKLILGGHLTS